MFGTLVVCFWMMSSIFLLQLLSCGLHHCTRLCHAGHCGQCIQMTHKTCRCGKKAKLVTCAQEFLCDARCSNLRQCGKHQCKRKVRGWTACVLSDIVIHLCCSAVTASVHLVSRSVGSNLPAGTTSVLLHVTLVTLHSVVCHCLAHLTALQPPGPCYPCVLTAELTCHCGATKLSVLCGKKKSTKPPRCREPCTLPSSCHHLQRHPHTCHFGPCPPCALPCGRLLPCGHSCTSRCHSEPVLPKRPSGQAPWVKQSQEEMVVHPCPPCLQLVSK